MDFDWNVWGHPIEALGVGVIVGSLFLLRGRSAPAPAAVKTNLEARQRAAVEALRTLELEREKLDPADYEAQKKAILADGAAAMRELEGAPAAVAGAPAADVALSDAALAALGAERKRLGDAGFTRALNQIAPGVTGTAQAAGGLAPEWKGAIYTTAVFAIIGALVYSAGDIATPRGDGGMSGGGGMGGGGAAAPAEPPKVDTSFLEQRVAANPNDLEALNRLTMLSMQNRDIEAAKTWSDKALAVNPKDNEARLNRALMTAEMGMASSAITKIDEVLADAPDMPEANLYKGLLLLMDNQPAAAVPFLEKAVALGMASPSVTQALAEARAQAGMPAPAAPGSDEVVLSGTINVDPTALGAVQGAATIYVSVKDGPGPPLAAKKLPVGPFPMQFTVTMADRPPMAASRPMPASFDLTVRADLDGNAMTKDPTEPVFVAPGTAKGATGLVITLAAP